MPTGRKTRSFQKVLQPVFSSQDGGKTWFKTPSGTADMGSQITESVGHHRLPNGSWDGGGPFYTCRVERSFPTTPVNLQGSSPSERLKASLGTPMPVASLPSEYRNLPPEGFRSKNLSDLDPYGATAIAQTAPTNPNADLGVALTELIKERNPTLPGVQTWKRRAEIVRAAGSEFLNVEFGWLPLVKDITDTAQSVRDGHDILNYYRSQSGTNVRREFAFPVENTSKTINEIGVYKPTNVPNAGGGWGPGFSIILGGAPVSQTIKTSSRRWFSGAFTHTLPDQSDSWSNLDRIRLEADKLFGITPTPELIWELTPWSWAVDWFTNTGDVIHNATQLATQGLVMRYGYMMEEKTTEITNSFLPNPFKTTFDYRSIPPQTITFRSKVRSAANPFGFGLTWEGLSPTQLAIAAALGITRLR